MIENEPVDCTLGCLEVRPWLAQQLGRHTEGSIKQLLAIA
jgi:hypothetical protein